MTVKTNHIKALLDDVRQPVGLTELNTDQAKELQTLLKTAGFSINSIDGVVGDETLGAWFDFQSATWSIPSNDIGWGTLRTLTDLAADARDKTAIAESSRQWLHVPGVGQVDLYASVVDGCGVNWNEMTRGGLRMPVSEFVSMNMVSFCKTLVPVRQHIGPIVITSAYRDPATNRRVGGASASWHLYNRPGQGAIDFYVKNEHAKTTFDKVKTFGWSGGLAYSASGGFVHIDNGPEGTWDY